MPGSTRASAGAYGTLFALQTVGVILVYWKGLPLYRGLVWNPAQHEARPENMAWLLVSVLLIQIGYWLRFRLVRWTPGRGPAVLAHVVMFLSRLVFVLATTVFSYVFLLQNPDLQLPTSRYALLLAALFSLYCYTQELEHLGKALWGNRT